MDSNGLQAGAEFEDDTEWACLSAIDVEQDLLEAEERAMELGDSRASEEELRSVLKRAGASGFNPDVFFSTDLALKVIASDIQAVQVQTTTLQLNAAFLVASLQRGPLRPPVTEQGHKTSVARLGDQMPLSIFGPDVHLQAELPTDLSMTAPASAAGGLVEYQKLLEGFPRQLFITRGIRFCVGDVNKHQDEKDIGRDELIVNGQAISGARDGYSAAVAALQTALESAGCSSCSEASARLLLSILNRTSSGFAAFEEVLRLYDCLDTVLVSPESAQAKPLEAAVLHGVALGRAHTRYSVRRADGGGEPLAVIDAIFVFRVATAMLSKLAAATGAWPVEEVPGAILMVRIDA